MGNRQRNLRSGLHSLTVRPRSYSTRSRLKSWSGGLRRSPSASPVREKGGKLTPPMPITPLDQWISSFGAGESYFSTRPPVDPMSVVFTSLPSANLPHQANIQQFLRTTNQNYAAQGRAVYQQPNVQTLPRRNMTRRGSKKIADDIVKELVENLPLEITSMNASTSKIIRSPQKLRRHHDTQKPMSSNSCSIAVQAFGKKVSPPRCDHNGSSVSDTGARRTDVPESETPNLEPSDDWIGGMRAMRDSHVRLVLRQLRHIERLNRALDRAARAFRTSTSSSPVRKSS